MKSMVKSDFKMSNFSVVQPYTPLVSSYTPHTVKVLLWSLDTVILVGKRKQFQVKHIKDGRDYRDHIKESQKNLVVLLSKVVRKKMNAAQTTSHFNIDELSSADWFFYLLEQPLARRGWEAFPGPEGHTVAALPEQTHQTARWNSLHLFFRCLMSNPTQHKATFS